MTTARTHIAKACQFILDRRCPVVSNTPAPCLIVAPHPDDEVLGCGGVILRKLSTGAPVHVAYMCLGNHSPDLQRFTHEFMVESRRTERQCSNAILGLAPENVSEFGIFDSRLEEHSESVVERLADLIARTQAEEVYIPCAFEPGYIPDHRASNLAARKAIIRSGASPTVFEYPVWLWRSFPLVSEREYGRLVGSRLLRRVYRDIKSFLPHVNCRVDVRSELAAKRAALNAYQSQVSSPFYGHTVPTLGGIDSGVWLERFFLGYEYFKRDLFPGR